MRSVGIKLLKNKLSSYLKYVRKGELVLVTDRGEVVAEIRKPGSSYALGNPSRMEAYLEECAANGSVHRPGSSAPPFPASSADLLRPPINASAQELLRESREDRY